METIGKYQIVRVLGQGGMGRVYEAVDPVIGRRVAIKTISANIVADEEARARFFREAQAAGRLSHHNLITIYDIGEADGSPYIVMEYLDGADLSRTIRGGRLSYDRKLQIMIDVCEGLAYAHGRDIVHRDIKPANIFITTHGQLKILDFGLARGTLSEVTQTGRIVGTPNYMAPEQIRGDEVDHRADIFAAGVVFYELLSGRKAFEGDSVATTMYKVLESHPQPVHLLDSALPPALSLVVERALAKEKTARYQTSSELLDALLQVRGSSSPAREVLTPPVPTPAYGAELAAPRASRQVRRRPLVIIGAIVALAIGSAAYLMTKGRSEKQEQATPVAKAQPPAAPLPAPAPPPNAPVPIPAPDASRAAPAPPPRAPIEPPQRKAPVQAPPAVRPPESVSDRPAVPREQPPPVTRDVPQPMVPPPVVPPPVTPPPVVAVAPPVVAAPPPAAPAASPPSVSDAPTAAENPSDAVRTVLTRYQLALESRDIDALKRIWPGLSGRQEEAIKAEFDRARGIAVRLDGVNVKITGSVAAVTCRRDYAVTTGDGQTLKTATEMLMTLSRRNGAWSIDAVRHQVVR
jgi:tRNA A-37 threonylcarbamoyl transferase component Bud32